MVAPATRGDITCVVPISLDMTTFLNTFRKVGGASILTPMASASLHPGEPLHSIALRRPCTLDS